MKRTINVTIIVIILLAITASGALAGSKARRPAILASADRVVELQRTDTGWDGTWYWYVGSTYNATNLTGATALGLLEAYNDTKDEAYLDAAKDAASFIMTHLGAGATSLPPHYPRLTAADVVFLHMLSLATGDPQYATRAVSEWNNLKISYPTVAVLDARFRSINRRSTWDIAFFMEAAYLSGDTTWADGAAAILADTSDTFYYGTDTWWHALNVAASLRALVYCGYGETYNSDVTTLLTMLIELVDDDTGVGGYIQDTAYAVLAFRAVGGAAHRYANDLARWIAENQEDDGGWLEDGYEYPEVDGEALRALASTVGSNYTLDGFNYGNYQVMNSSWMRELNSGKAEPFTGE